MKLNINNTILLLSILFIISGCTKDMNFEDVSVTPVNKLYAPASNESVLLINDKNVTLFFDWEPSKAEDSGFPLYEILFVKKGGDFSDPLYVKPSDANSARSYVKIAHTDLDYICSLADIKPGQSVTLVWTVTSTRGLNQVLANESRELTLTRY